MLKGESGIALTSRKLSHELASILKVDQANASYYVGRLISTKVLEVVSA